MTTNEAIEFLNEYQEKNHAYTLAIQTMSYDMATIAPKDGNPFRIKMMSLLSGELFDHMTKKEHLEKIKEIESMDLGEVQNENVRQLVRDLRTYMKLPRDFFVEYQQKCSTCNVIWEEAKKNNDWNSFKEPLKEIIQLSKQRASYLKDENQSIYDFMLDEFEPGMSIEKYDAFFALIKKRLLPFIQKLIEEGSTIDDSPLYQNFPEADQIKVMEIIKKYMNFNPNRCYMGVSVHPFTSPFSLKDVRLTTAYKEDSLVSSIFSIIHEYGHAQYMMNVSEEFEGLTLEQNMSNGMHESQSRLLENYIAKSKAYWTCLYDDMQKIFPSQLKNVTLDDFVEMINVSRPSLIRTEADELTYPIHILIRYELEKQILNDEVDYENLNKIWADKYEEYLHVRPAKDSEGILQDVHWSQASFGYFPTYALGTAYSAQFYNAMKRDLDIDKELSSNNFKALSDWLKDNIHQYGSFKNANQLLMDICHESFDPNYYIDYLIDKYSKLYHLN